MTPDQTKTLQKFMKAIATYAPDFKGLVSVEEGVKVNMDRWEKISIENGDSGAFISQFGNKRWF
jgi:hypothetical protein